MSRLRAPRTLDAMNSSDVTVTLKDMWATRPMRPRNDRKIAGVGAAIARRYDLDPVLVRVGLVAAAFTGVGLAFYVLAWALLPDEPADGSAPDRRRPRLGTLIIFGILAVIAIGDLADNPVRILLPAAAIGTLLFLLHRSRADRGIPGPATPGIAPAAGPTARSDASPDQVTPPAWDPLGAAPFAWDLPEPGPAPAPTPTPRRSRVTPITLAAALLAGGVTALVLLATGGLTDLPVLFGVVLSVLGGGLLVGAFVRSGRGLIPFALLASALTWGVLAAPLDRLAEPPRDLRLVPASAAALAPRYENSVGDVELDLRGIDLTVPPGPALPPVATRIDAGAGSVEVWVPANADVRFTGSVGVGSVAFAGQESDGPDARLQVNDLGADGVASGRPIVLDVQAGVGSVEVHRG
jgi:phage shock protein PspC (stress-responsive transcriptional regulator)